MSFVFHFSLDLSLAGVVVGCAAHPGQTTDDPPPEAVMVDADVDWATAIAAEIDPIVVAHPGAFVHVAVARVDTGEVVARHGAVDQLHAVGSTIKPLTVAEAYDAGVAHDLQIAGDPVVVGAIEVTDHHAVPAMTVDEALMRSSNVAIVRVTQQVGALDLYDEVAPWVHLPAPRDEAAATLALFGGDVELTTLSLLGAYTILANEGVDPQTGERRVLAASAHRVLAALQRAVTEEPGTARRAEVPGLWVAGKTGTAKGPGAGRHTANFFGLVSAPDAATPTWAVAVVVEGVPETEFGGSVAAPAFARIVSRALAP